MNKDKYHEMKVAEAERAAAIKQQATIDYNIMMGKLEDPEGEEVNGDE